MTAWRRVLARALAVLLLLSGGLVEAAGTKGTKGTKAQKAKKARPAPPPPPDELRGVAALQPFFRDVGDPGRVTRVLHFGDSHVAADYWTGELRRLLQARFGDAGPGYVMPGKPWKYFRHALAKSVSSGGWETTGLGRDTVDCLCGLSGTALLPTGEGSAGVDAVFRRFRASFLAGTTGSGTIASISVDGVLRCVGVLEQGPDLEGNVVALPGECRVVQRQGIEGTTFDLVTVDEEASLDEAPHRLEIRDASGGSTRILGVDLTNGRPGVLVDTLGINGAELGSLGKWNPELRRLLLGDAAPSLVIVSYGTNEMGRPDFDFATYRDRATLLLEGLRADLPEASILVTAPIERGTKKRKGASTVRTNAPLVTRALREAADRTGCAFWDAKAAMGGDGSIRKWAAAHLAQKDLVHLTGPGYARLAELLYRRLMAARETEGSGP